VPPRQHRKVSGKDVAEAAGVSRTTVSFVLNDRPNSAIPEETRRRVLTAAEALGYAPSPEARALKLGHSDVVLCLLPDWPITGPLGVLLESLSARLADSGLTMLAHQRRPDDDLSQVLGALTPTTIVAMCDLSEIEVSYAEARGISLVAFMGDVPGRPDLAGLRQSDIGRLQVAALVDRGHASVAYVLPHDRNLDWFSEPRLEGAREEAQRRNADLIEYRDVDNGGARLATWVISAARDRVTGICAYNDEVALSILMAAHGAGIAVPEDVSLIGVDDSCFTRMTRPPLSSVGFGLGVEVQRLAALITESGTEVRGSDEILQLQIRQSVQDLSATP